MEPKPTITKEVLEQIIWVRQSGLCSMYDSTCVVATLYLFDKFQAVVWIFDHPTLYVLLITQGKDAFEIVE